MKFKSTPVCSTPPDTTPTFKMKTNYTPIILGIQSHGFHVTASAGNLTATNPKTQIVEFSGNIDAAQEWLERLDNPTEVNEATIDIDRFEMSFRRAMGFLILAILFSGSAPALGGVLNIAVGSLGVVALFAGIYFFCQMNKESD